MGVQVLPPPPCRPSLFATCPPILSPHALEGRGGLSTWTGACPSKMLLRLNSNLHRESKLLLHLLLMAQGRGGSCCTGSPPHPRSVVPSAPFQEPIFVDRKTTKLEIESHL